MMAVRNWIDLIYRQYYSPKFTSDFAHEQNVTPTHAVLCLDYTSMGILIPTLACPIEAEDNPTRVHTITHQTTQMVRIKTHKTSTNEVNYPNHINTWKKRNEMQIP